MLVLGAGSSKNFGFPLGLGLRDTLARDLNIKLDDMGSKLECGSYEIYQALEHLVYLSDDRLGNTIQHRQAALQIASAMRFSSSIDEYIERHRSDRYRADCAKLGIAKAIVEAERSSNIYIDRSSGQVGLPTSSADSWLAFLLRDLTRGLETEDLHQAFRNIFVVNFNYDRCVEYFVFHWLKQVYELSDHAAGAIAQSLNIYHPYGSLGNLEYHDSGQTVPFGSQPRPSTLVDIARRIRTYSEAQDDDTSLSLAHEKIAKCKNLVFLGFGFLVENLNLLALPASMSRTTISFYASTFELAEPKWDLAKSRVSKACRVTSPQGTFARNFNGDCEEFWNEFGEILVQ